MARDWSELFITGEDGQADGSDRAEQDAGGGREHAAAGRAGKRGGLLRRLRESMAKTRQALGSEIQATLFGVLDEQTWERLEEALIMADVGASTTASVVETLESGGGRGQARGRRGAQRAADRAAGGRPPASGTGGSTSAPSPR